jgi:hypothetical protein
VSLFSFEVDPQKVLGVPAGATLEQIRDAYRQKAKRYHPDAGGEDWAFRIIAQSYEMLSRARVVRAAHAEHATEAKRQPQPQPQQHHPRQPKAEQQAASVHAGIHDKHVPPENMVALELLCVRFLWDESDFLWLTQRAPDEERFLSCSLNFGWPDPAATGSAPAAHETSSKISALEGIFDQMLIATRVVTSRSQPSEDRFDAWLSYSNFDRAWKAVGAIHQLLNARGFGLRQWSRDLFIPRAGR